MPATRQKPGSGPDRPARTGPGLNALTVRREGSRPLTPGQEQAYLLLCAAADRLRHHDLAAVEAMHTQACTMDARYRGVPVVVTAAYDLLQTILRNEIVDADGRCTCWLTAAGQALTIRNTLSQAMLVHALLALTSHPLVTAPARQQIRAQYAAQQAQVTPQAATHAVASTPTLVDACVTGGVMSAAMIQDVLAAAAGLGPASHR